MWPNEIKNFIGNAPIIDTSGYSGAKTYFIDKDSGYFLKIWDKSKLQKDFLTLQYFHKYNLSPEPLLMLSKDFDYLITKKVEGIPSSDSYFLEQPEMLAYSLGKILRKFHDNFTKEECPFTNSVNDMMIRVEKNYRAGNFDNGMMNYVKNNDVHQIYHYIKDHFHVLKDDVVIHGDYCLPNILLDKKFQFINFIDLNAAGIGDRHYDLHWGMWSLNFNLNTRKFADVFLDSYGRDVIDEERLKVVSYLSCLDE